MKSDDNLNDHMLSTIVNQSSQKVKEFYSEADIRKRVLNEQKEAESLPQKEEQGDDNKKNDKSS